MNYPINLWECLTSQETNHRRDENARGPRITSEQLCELGKTGRWNAQELDLKPTEEGWIIRIYSAYTSEDMYDHSGIEIIIPVDNRKPVKVLKDQTGRIAHIHD